VSAAHWYKDGLRFECTMCGACCSGPSGYVLFNDEEAAAIARRLGVTVDRFIEEYTEDMGVTIAGRRRSIREVRTEHGHDCVFLDRVSAPGKAVCSLYEDRPQQCRSFPFWPEHIESARAWNELARTCEGIGRGGFVPASEIRLTAERHRRDRAPR
jgi:Fe-S-cluster containining protein